jgi:hypothetical protein
MKKLERKMRMKNTTKNACTNNRAVIEEVGNQEWRFAERPYDVEMKFNDLLEARDYGTVSPAEMERQLRDLLHEAPNFIDAYHHLAMLLDQRGKDQEAQLLWQQAVNIGMQCFIEKFSAAGNKLERGWLETAPFCGPTIPLVFNTWSVAIQRWRCPYSERSCP